MNWSLARGIVLSLAALLESEDKSLEYSEALQVIWDSELCTTILVYWTSARCSVISTRTIYG